MRSLRELLIHVKSANHTQRTQSVFPSAHCEKLPLRSLRELLFTSSPPITLNEHKVFSLAPIARNSRCALCEKFLFTSSPPITLNEHKVFSLAPIVRNSRCALCENSYSRQVRQSHSTNTKCFP